jgi:hypothetical protein
VPRPARLDAALRLAYPDLKTTAAAASPDQWGRKVMFDTGCDIQDAFYRRGLKKLGINEHAYLLFVVAEVDEPHAMATHRLDPCGAAMADRKVEHAIRLFGMCQERNWWPGYRAETAWHDPPPWHEQRWIEREDRRVRGRACRAGRIQAARADAPRIIRHSRTPTSATLSDCCRLKEFSSAPRAAKAFRC